jgi:2-polyprenyl-3-methyl-5-hydroxy-6-metoxy-1,4-benzoquinol methylase
LFNAKAGTWNQKYEAGGALAFRVAAFEMLLRQQLSANAKVLDLGCGTGAIASVLAASGFRVTACDIAEEMVVVGKRIFGDSTIDWRVLAPEWDQLPFDSCAFDAIIASSVLEYLPNVNRFLFECHRVLKSNGMLIATVPDARALVRKLENLVRHATALLSGLPGWRQIPKLHSYATYLKCSRNRMSLHQWQTIGTRAHFGAVNQIETNARRKSLVFLEFRKQP